MENHQKVFFAFQQEIEKHLAGHKAQLLKAMPDGIYLDNQIDHIVSYGNIIASFNSISKTVAKKAIAEARNGATTRKINDCIHNCMVELMNSVRK